MGWMEFYSAAVVLLFAVLVDVLSCLQYGACPQWLPLLLSTASQVGMLRFTVLSLSEARPGAPAALLTTEASLLSVVTAFTVESE
jgi:hypothetical protein